MNSFELECSAWDFPRFLSRVNHFPSGLDSRWFGLWYNSQNKEENMAMTKTSDSAIPGSRVFLEKVIVRSAGQEIVCLLWLLGSSLPHSQEPLTSVLFLTNQVQTLRPFSFTLHFIIILLSRPSFSELISFIYIFEQKFSFRSLWCMQHALPILSVLYYVALIVFSDQ